MKDRIKEIQKEIVEKKFNKKTTAGYDPEDVDAFFDKIIDCMGEMENLTISLKAQNEELKEKNLKLEEEFKISSDEAMTLRHENNDLKKDGYANYRMSEEISRLKSKVKNKNESDE
jgi:DivIVA domain-containing protein